jgi:electron transfer flavoprotein beta subunit
MRIIVPIKQVPETTAVKMDEATGTMIREGVEAIVNPLDLYAIETALRLREAHGGQVVAISMGPPKADRALREAIAMGCDAGVLVSDKPLAGSDTWATSYVLAAAIRKLGGAGVGGAGVGGAGVPPAGGSSTGETPVPPVPPVPPVAPIDLVICGERATDGDTGQVGPGIASFLDLPVATYVSRIERLHGGVCRVRRLVEDGYEVLEVATPCVLTVVKEIADPRLPTLRGKIRAKAERIPLWTVGDLDIEPSKVGLEGSPTRVVKIFKPKVARECVKLAAKDEQSLHEAVEKLVAFLHDRQLI